MGRYHAIPWPILVDCRVPCVPMVNCGAYSIHIEGVKIRALLLMSQFIPQTHLHYIVCVYIQWKHENRKWLLFTARGWGVAANKKKQNILEEPTFKKCVKIGVSSVPQKHCIFWMLGWSWWLYGGSMSNSVGYLKGAIDILCYFGLKWDILIFVKMTWDVYGSS